MKEMKLVTYCGLYCGLCAERGRIPRQARDLRDSMASDGWDFWGHDMPGFKEFWEFLGERCDPEKACPGCRADGGNPGCGIRTCARERAVEACPFCGDYPCKLILDFEKVYPTLVSDGKRLRDIGVDAWVATQEERVRTGFVYSDIRVRPRSSGGDEI